MAKAKTLPPELLTPPTITLAEEHVREAILEWCAARGRPLPEPVLGHIHPVQWRMRNEGGVGEPDMHFDGATVSLPMP